MKIALSILSLAVLTLVGCDDDHDHDHGSVDGELCEHMANGPSESVTAAAAATDAPPGVNEEHTRYDIALVDMEGMKGGWVAFEAAEATEYIIGVSTTDAITLIDSADQPIAIEGSGPNPECSDVALQHTVDLPVGTARIQIGPTESGAVSIVIEEAGAHGGE